MTQLSDHDRAELAEIAAAVRDHHTPTCANPACRLCAALVRYDQAGGETPPTWTAERVQAELEDCAVLLRFVDEIRDGLRDRRASALLAGRDLDVGYADLGRWAHITDFAINKALQRARRIRSNGTEPLQGQDHTDDPAPPPPRPRKPRRS